MAGVAGLGASPEGSSPGLALYRQTSPKSGGDSEGASAPEWRQSSCPNRRGMVLLNYESGEVRAARCGRLACPVCVTAEAYLRAGAIWLANPRRAIRMSLVAESGDPDPWPTARRRMNKTREHYFAETGRPIGQWVYHVEPNPKGTGYHSHAWEHGPHKIDAVALDRAAHRAGAGWAKVETIRSVGDAASYGLKGLGYGLKGTESDPSVYLHCNGNRLTHQSRGFFRSAAGVTLPVRQAQRHALDALFGEREPGQWALVTESAVTSLQSRGIVPTPTRV